MRKGIPVIALLTCSFLLPSWGLAELHGASLCCYGSARGAAADDPASAGHAGHGQAAYAPETAEAADAQAGRHAGHGADPHAGHGAAHHGTSHSSSHSPSHSSSTPPPASPADAGDGAAGAAGADASGFPAEAADDHASCTSLSCLLAPAASLPEATPQILGQASGVAIAQPDPSLPGPSLRSLFHPPRA
jgi:hypothetical protein